MSKTEDALIAKAKKYVRELQKKGVWITLEQAMDEIDEAHRRAGRRLVESLEDVQERIRRKERDEALEEAYDEDRD